MNKNFWFILITGFLLIGICVAMMAVPASAYDRIPQGGIVYLNETVDISGVAGGYTHLVYTNQYSTDFAAYNDSITYMIELPQQKEKYYQFYIDPEIFWNRTGLWFRYDGTWNSHVNNRAFKVVAERPFVNETDNATLERVELLQVLPPVVPEKHVADYLLARGDPFNVTYNYSKASIWMFGRITGIYNRPVINGTARFNASETSGLEAGSYTLLYYSPGVDRQYNMRMNGDILEYFDSVVFKVRSVDTRPLTPPLVLDRIRWIAGVNDDNFTEYKLEIQDPKIEIVSVDTLLTDDYFNYNMTGVLQIRGYTNLANNTPLYFILDETKTPEKMLGQSRAQNRWNTTTLAVESPGSMRYFDLGIPIRWDAMPPGQHTITAYGTHGAKMTVPFWVYDLPEGQTRPNQTIKYIGGYEFKPTPTPEIVTVEVTRNVIQTQVVVRVETVDYDRLAGEQASKSVPIVAGYVIVSIPLLYIGSVVLRAVYRLLNKKKKEEGNEK